MKKTTKKNKNTQSRSTQKETPKEPKNQETETEADENIDDDPILGDGEDDQNEAADDPEADEDDQEPTKIEKTADAETEYAPDDKCLYKYAEEESDDEVEEEVFEEEELKTATDIVPPENRITKPYLYDFERVRLICDRTKQLLLGAKPMVKDVSHLSEKHIAEFELLSALRERRPVMPLYIQRVRPDNLKEVWYPHEFKNGS